MDLSPRPIEDLSINNSDSSLKLNQNHEVDAIDDENLTDGVSTKVIRSNKRAFEKVLDESRVSSPKKVPRIEIDDVSDLKKYRDICENIKRKKKEHQQKNELRHATFKSERRFQRLLKAKEDLIGCLEQRISELEEGSKDSDVSTPIAKLLETIKKLEAENEELKVKMIDTEFKLKRYMKDCERFESLYSNRTSLGLTVFDGNVVPSVQGATTDIAKLKSIFTLTETKLKQLQKEKEELHLKLSESESNRMIEEKRFIEDKNCLKNEFLDEQIKYTEHLAQCKPLIVVEKKVVSQVDEVTVKTVQDTLNNLTNDYHCVKDLITQISSTIKTETEETTRKIQKAISEVDSRNKELVHRYTNEVQLRKLYHNQLVELRGNIRVYCRVRPPIKEDEEVDSVVSFDTYDDGIINITSKGKTQQFHFDKVFPMDASQSQVFDEVRSLVRSAIDGFHVCIFAYGQTGSGKTYTMEGTVSDPGVNQRALSYLFEEAQNTVWQYEIEASMLEIYNETIRDLLDADCEDKNKLEIKMKPEGGLYVPGLIATSVKSLDEVNEIFETGRRNRATAKTMMNERSSRSHCLLLLSIVGVNTITGNKTFGRLNLVDLAGSERTSKTQVEGTRLQEAKHINKSLSCLGDVINALKNKHSHVPYRNSKLTYFLQESLDGDSKTLMILQISPVEKNVSESIFTLNFGQRGMSAELGAATKKMEDGKGTPSSARRPNCETPKSPGTSLTPSNRTPNFPKTVSVPSKLSVRYK
ncbi:kinesin protein KIFC3 isoform X2 [Biomphalaria glabrata]|nr:kinesin protein KIFC3 isoform X2 [Biomphalaria glabrata]